MVIKRPGPPSGGPVVVRDEILSQVTAVRISVRVLITVLVTGPGAPSRE